MTLKYFKLSEFDSPDVPGSGAQMKEHLLKRLDLLREAVGFPLSINSGFRTEEHNAKVKGSANSAHLRGLAVDIVAMSGRAKFDIVRAALDLGFHRIGIAKTFVHLDMDESLPGQCIWTY